MYFTNQVLRSDFQLESTYSCAHIDVRKIQTGAMNISRKKFLHPDGRASATDIPCERKQFLDRYKVALLVAAHFGSQLEVHLVLAGNDADEMSGFVTMQDQCLEHTPRRESVRKSPWPCPEGGRRWFCLFCLSYE